MYRYVDTCLISSRKYKYVCPYLLDYYIRHASLKRHLHYHTNEKLYVCKVCSNAFSVGYVLKVHERIRAGEKHV
jgi:hypothetical protein